MRGADALSRLPELVCLVSNDPIDRLMLVNEQNNDPLLKDVLAFHKDPNSVSNQHRRNKIKSLTQFSKVSDDGMLMKYAGP